MFLPHAPAPIGVRWHDKLQSSSRPPGFRVLMFPKNSTVPIRDTTGKIIGSLDRAMANEVEELEQQDIILQLSPGTGTVSKSDLVFLLPDRDMTRYIEAWRASIATRVANLSTADTWAMTVRVGDWTTVTIQLSDSEETRRWRYQTDGTSLRPKEFAYKNRMDEFFESERFSNNAAIVAMGPAALMSVLWTRRRMRRDSGSHPAKDTTADNHS